MEPRIRYATTTDGASIACWTMGEGRALVNPPPALPWSHIELEWQIPEWRHWYEHLTETMSVVRYDNRGSGLSSREAPIYSLETHLLDLDAVVNRLDLDRFALFGLYFNAPIAIAYAARNPKRVSHLVLWCPVANAANGTSRSPEQEEALDRLLAVDYELFTETVAHTAFGWSEGDVAHRVAQYMRRALPHDYAQACWKASEEFDVTELLPQITQPTLVMHRREFPLLDVEVSKLIAARIPDAHLKVLEGASLSPYVGNMGEALEAINGFLSEGTAARRTHGHEQALAPIAAPTAGFRTIMFTDMQESTATTQRLGDAQAQELVRLHNDIVGDALGVHGGSRVKHTGDGIMAAFLTASSAVEAAVAIQRAFAVYNEANRDSCVNVRIGINAGEPLVEGDDYFGTAVQLAARVCSSAEPGEILSSDVVRQLVAGKGFMFADRGESALRGFEDPVRLYEVRWREDAG
jgi:class 3 adenylate cyclase/pimeloyl-ACP methyl ester carboxylesterase